MIGIDTNVLVRYLIRDDPAQAERAARFLERECTREMPGFVSQIVLCELVWVLERGYGYARTAIADTLDMLLGSATIEVEAEADLRAAIGKYRAGADFADGLIATAAARHGCPHTVTFDRRAPRAGGFRLLA